MWSNNSNQREKGSILFLAVMLMLVLLAAGLGVSEIIVVELRSLRGLGDSVFAFGAADAGVERGLYVDKVSCNAIEPDAATDLLNCVNANAPTTTPETLSNNSQYLLEVKPDTDPTCPGDNYCVESKGRFQGTGSPEESIRKVQIAR
jgi:Tfp pilus assembly protein PilX